MLLLEGVYDRPIDLNAKENEEFLKDVRVGDKLWVTMISLGRKGVRLDKYVKPTAVEVINIDLKSNHYPFGLDVSSTKLRYGNQAFGYYASLTRAKDECEYFHDLRVIKIADSIGRRDFSKKQNMFKKLIRMAAPVDDAMTNALNWKDTLGEEEKRHIEKLIEMSRTS